MRKLFVVLPAVFVLLFSCKEKEPYKPHLSNELKNALSSGNDSLRWDCYYALLDSLKDTAYTQLDIDMYIDTILADGVYALSLATEYQQKSRDKNWVHDNADYGSIRYSLSLMLDILGYINQPKSKEILEHALHLEDNYERVFAAVSLVRLGKPVSADVLESIAKDEESLKWLCCQMYEMGKEDQIPQAYYKQELLARSIMINWLTYPTELGRIPDSLELVKIIREKEDGRFMDYYVFKFKSNHPDWEEKGWMAGVAGAFIAMDMPTPYSQGNTFSNFEEWDSKTPEEHMASLSGAIDNAIKTTNEDN